VSRPEVALLIDFGSTFTKIRAIDLRSAEIVSSAQAPSTVETNVIEGLDQALTDVRATLGRRRVDGALRLASSSAAGGLRIVAVGLIPDLTAEAAKRAALGAGAKVVATFAHGLTDVDLAEMTTLRPDIVVLAGGTDGGNRACIEDNAKLLAELRPACPIIVAGNRNAASVVAAVLRDAGCEFVVVDNVLPAINRLAVEACGEAIREIFMERIVHAKGLADVQQFVGAILMPTPQAVLRGCELLANGTPDGEGLGDLVCVDVGGATTDVYSIGTGLPHDPRVVMRGLVEPEAKRTVEGDLGVRINAPGIVDAVGEGAFLADLDVDDVRGLAEDVRGDVERLAASTATLPGTDRERSIDLALGRTASAVAIRRHAGTIELAYGPEGPISIQTGKDLRASKTLIGTGGVFAANPAHASDLFTGCLRRPDETHLVPEQPHCYVDRDYALYAVGLLAEREPEVAYRAATRHLIPVGAAAAVG
jgi:uncharacterized protein (TIGR01319 family)